MVFTFIETAVLCHNCYSIRVFYWSGSHIDSGVCPLHYLDGTHIQIFGNTEKKCVLQLNMKVT